MRVVASEPATELIQEQGGRLYVWLKQAHCCRSVTRLEAAPTPPTGKAFRRMDGTEPFELYLPAALTRLPDELHVELARRRGRVEVYWNGGAWVI